MKTLILLLCIGLSAMQAKSKDLSFIIQDYMKVKNGLVESSKEKVMISAKSFFIHLDTFQTSGLNAKDKKSFVKIQGNLKKHVKALSESNSIEAQRKAFALISNEIKLLLKEVKLGKQVIYRFYCPMKKELWFSWSKEVKNPYYGQQMLNCGSLEETYP